MRNADPLLQLQRSEFRRSFHLTPVERRILEQHGYDAMRQFASDIIQKRLTAPFNDGRQTPKTGHPVFIAQHATATCCRKCLQKWHQIPQHRELTEEEQIYITLLLLRWIKKDVQVPLARIQQEQYALRKKYLRRSPLFRSSFFGKEDIRIPVSTHG